MGVKSSSYWKKTVNKKGSKSIFVLLPTTRIFPDTVAYAPPLVLPVSSKSWWDIFLTSSWLYFSLEQWFLNFSVLRNQWWDILVYIGTSMWINLSKICLNVCVGLIRPERRFLLTLSGFSIEDTKVSIIPYSLFSRTQFKVMWCFI